MVIPLVVSFKRDHKQTYRQEINHLHRSTQETKFFFSLAKKSIWNKSFVLEPVCIRQALTRVVLYVYSCYISGAVFWANQ